MIGLYVHIPFCAQKCNYCDFCSYPSLTKRQSEYCDALAREVMLYKDRGLHADTVYFGGGTPSLLDTSSIAKVMGAIHDSFNVSQSAEITIEANPCTVTAQKAADYRALGFNRVSLGAQSFIDSELSALGRLHSAAHTQGLIRKGIFGHSVSCKNQTVFPAPGADLPGGVRADDAAAL